MGLDTTLPPAPETALRFLDDEEFCRLVLRQDAPSIGFTLEELLRRALCEKRAA